ncbi:MAG: SPOR domain-containing protein [Bacteroidota bacterium]
MEIDITKEIKDLLFYNEFVIIPGFGTFITRYESARVDPAAKTLNPPKRNVEFKKNLSHDDDLLRKHIAKTLDISEKSAGEIISEIVSDLRQRLNKGEEIVFEGLGVIIEEPGGEYVFKAEEDINLLADSFGMDSVKLFEIEDKEPEQEEEKQEVPEKKPVITYEKPQQYYTPAEAPNKSKNWLIILVTAAVVVLLVALFIFTDFYSTVYKTIDDIVTSKSNEEVIDSALQEYLETYGIGAELSGKSKMSEALSPAVDEKAGPVYQVKDTTYYLVAGSFRDLINARKHMSNLEKKGYQPEIISSENRFRVTLYSFQDREKAFNELERLRNQKDGSNVWILKKI